jgi:hypothetical protein
MTLVISPEALGPDWVIAASSPAVIPRWTTR